MGADLTLDVCDSTKTPWELVRSYRMDRYYLDFYLLGMPFVQCPPNITLPRDVVERHPVPAGSVPQSSWIGEEYVLVRDLDTVLQYMDTPNRAVLRRILREQAPDRPVILTWS